MQRVGAMLSKTLHSSISVSMLLLLLLLATVRAEVAVLVVSIGEVTVIAALLCVVDFALLVAGLFLDRRSGLLFAELHWPAAPEPS